MSTRKLPRVTAPPKHGSPGSGEKRRVTPDAAPESVRDAMPTLVDEVELEAARIASTKQSSIPPSFQEARERPSRPTTDHEIEVAWDVDDEPADPEELFPKYVRMLGPFSRVPIVTVPFEKITTLALDHRMGFLVALIDGTSSIQTLLDVAGMAPREVLHALVTLRDLGIVAFRA
jgi:hypothetical protein